MILNEFLTKINVNCYVQGFFFIFFIAVYLLFLPSSMIFIDDKKFMYIFLNIFSISSIKAYDDKIKKKIGYMLFIK